MNTELNNAQHKQHNHKIALHLLGPDNQDNITYVLCCLHCLILSSKFVTMHNFHALEFMENMQRLQKGGAPVPREKENYRENLAMLLEEFPEKKLLTPKDVARWAGRDPRTIRKFYFDKGQAYITIPQLASRIS